MAVVAACSVIGGLVLICAVTLLLRKFCCCSGEAERPPLPTVTPHRRRLETERPWHMSRVIPDWTPRGAADAASAPAETGARGASLAREGEDGTSSRPERSKKSREKSRSTNK